eukprot:s7042_g1.t1
MSRVLKSEHILGFQLRPRQSRSEGFEGAAWHRACPAWLGRTPRHLRLSPLISWALETSEERSSINAAQQLASMYTQHEMSLGAVSVSKSTTLQDVLANMKQMIQNFMRNCTPASLPDMLV